MIYLDQPSNKQLTIFKESNSRKLIFFSMIHRYRKKLDSNLKYSDEVVI